MDLDLAGKKVVVTGGSRGIGHAIVNTFLADGASVSTCARGEEGLQKVKAQWDADAHRFFTRQVDVTEPQSVQDWIDWSAQQMQGIDILVSNVTTRIESMGLQRWQDTFEADLLQHIRTTEYALPHLKDGSKGSIVYIASIASVMTANMPSETEYGSMKAALVSYATQLANKLGKDGIRVNLVSPGPIYHQGGFWQMVEQQQPDLFKRAEAISVFKRLGTAQEVANSVVFLASPAASNITAANLRIDGGAIKTVNF